MALRRRLVVMGPNARVRPTVTPVQRSNGVSPTPNPRGVEGRDLLLWQGQRQARTKVGTHHIGLRGCTSTHAAAWASNWLLPTTAAASLASIYGVIVAGICSTARERAAVSQNCCQIWCRTMVPRLWSRLPSPSGCRRSCCVLRLEPRASASTRINSGRIEWARLSIARSARSSRTLRGTHQLSVLRAELRRQGVVQA